MNHVCILRFWKTKWYILMEVAAIPPHLTFARRLRARRQTDIATAWCTVTCQITKPMQHGWGKLLQATSPYFLQPPGKFQCSHTTYRLFPMTPVAPQLKCFGKCLNSLLLKPQGWLIKVSGLPFLYFQIIYEYLTLRKWPKRFLKGEILNYPHYMNQWTNSPPKFIFSLWLFISVFTPVILCMKH